MMNSSICTALFLNALIMLSLLILYFKDPDFFNSKMYYLILKLNFISGPGFENSEKNIKKNIVCYLPLFGIANTQFVDMLIRKIFQLFLMMKLYTIF